MTKIVRGFLVLGFPNTSTFHTAIYCEAAKFTTDEEMFPTYPTHRSFLTTHFSPLISPPAG